MMTALALKLELPCVFVQCRIHSNVFVLFLVVDAVLIFTICLVFGNGEGVILRRLTVVFAKSARRTLRLNNIG